MSQLRNILQWKEPQEYQLFSRYMPQQDEIKNASKLIIQPGQGCIFTYEGTIKGVFSEPGMYDIATDNRPFITTLKKFMNQFESEHKTGCWFYRTADIVNVRWGTRMPITYNDPVYGFPVNLRAYGNFSVRISEPEKFFSSIVAGSSNYYAYELQELLLSRISQPVGHYLANAKFSYAEVDANLSNIASDAARETSPDFVTLGFELLDFRIEGSSFDEETDKRIAGISDVQADVKAAKLAGVSFEELQKMLALRDTAKNTGAVITSMDLNTGNTLKNKLRELKALHEEGLLDDDEFKAQKEILLKQL
jgi:membrane protease subunit (stomatin/prohibitin family)